MQLLLDAIGIELQLFCWVFLGSFVGLVVELSTGDKKKSSVLFQSKLEQGSTFAWICICAINIIVGSLFAYASAPFIIDYLNVEQPFRRLSTGFMVGVAGLSLIRGYANTWRNRKNVMSFMLKILDFVRTMK